MLVKMCINHLIDKATEFTVDILMLGCLGHVRSPLGKAIRLVEMLALF